MEQRDRGREGREGEGRSVTLSCELKCEVLGRKEAGEGKGERKGGIMEEVLAIQKAARAHM